MASSHRKESDFVCFVRYRLCFDCGACREFVGSFSAASTSMIQRAQNRRALVYLAAHELRHLWQAARWRDDRKSANLPLYHGARGKFSEVDTEGFAITMLREWRHGC